MSASPPEIASLLRSAAALLEELHARTPGGSWETAGLLASRPEVVARYDDGTTEHVADARARSAPWLVALSPAVGGPLIAWLRTTADALEAGRLPADAAAEAASLARALLEHR
ncbi:hypothetical protein [Actinomycetospora sp.]|uniref:hypothetical protein n=1 Tax=Actinomycetospora sp. TaxID=1872135 RepID=UPI002F426F5A